MTLFVKNCVPVSLELYHTALRRFPAARRFPSIWISPELCFQSPVSTMAKLVFPAPFFPVKAVICPLYSEKFSSEKIQFFFRLQDRRSAESIGFCSGFTGTGGVHFPSVISRNP